MHLNSFRISWIFLVEMFKAMTVAAALKPIKEKLLEYITFP
jgi:hypothetical protein